VTLEGSINSSPFTITRTKLASKGNLVFHLDGVDLTTQSVKETQAVIEEKLGVNPQILARTMFHGQHALNGLLEATDAKLKDELSLLVPLGLWQDIATLARAKARESGKRASEFNGMISMRAEDVEKLSLRRNQAEETLLKKQIELDTLEVQFQAEILQMQTLTEEAGEIDFDAVETQIEKVSSESQVLDEQYKNLIVLRDSDLGPLQSSFNDLSNSISSLSEKRRLDEREVFAASMKVETAKEKVTKLEEKWSVDLSSGGSDLLVTPDTCPTCLQPIASNEVEHSHADLKLVAEQEIDEALGVLRDAEANLEAASKELSEYSESLGSREETKAEMQDEIERQNLSWSAELSKTEQDIRSKRQDYTHLSEQLSMLAKKSQLDAKRDAALASINTGKAALQFADDVFSGLADEIREAENRLNKLTEEMDEQRRIGRTMSDLGERFGQRGVQTFVLQNVVDALQTISQTYLDDLSDGAQRLELSLDAGDRISRRAYVCGADGLYKERPLATLSGGQWRRCSLALTFGFSELVARRGKLRPSMCVLDEPLTHLDRSGRAKVGDVIRRMLRPPDDAGLTRFGGLGMSTVLLILQDLAAEELDEAFDCIDEVVKENCESYVKVDELS
jgi:DNA repair exonuclease SbcCD ATPase subunit